MTDKPPTDLVDTLEMNRPFPIMPPDKHNERQYIIGRGIRIMDGVSWDMMEEHEAQAERNHNQSLRVLAGRGGLSACEAVAVLEDRDWRMMPLDEAFRRLGEIERDWLKKKQLTTPQRKEGEP